MKYTVDKKNDNVKFVNCDSKKGFNYIELADSLYEGNKVEILDYGTLSQDEKNILNKTIDELNELSDSKKRKKMISQLSDE